MQISQPVIFFPGTQCDERVWFQCWRNMNLLERSYVPLQWAENLEQMKALASDRILGYPDKVHLVGFSMGGYIAGLSALAHPERVASLTLVGYSSDGLTDAEHAQRKQTVEFIRKGKYQGMSKQRLGMFVHPDKMEDPLVGEMVLDMDKDLGGAVLAAHIESTTPREALTTKLAKLSLPIHIIAGDSDKVAPLEKLQHMHRQFKHSTLTVLKDTGHMSPLERPEEVAQGISQHF